MIAPQQYFVEKNGYFPGSKFPVLHYEQALQVPTFFPGKFVSSFLRKHNWSNNWRNGIYTFHHYHSTTHEAMAVIKGQAMILLGGMHGRNVLLKKGDIIVVPAGVAHMNLGNEKDLIFIGGYPSGRNYDMNYGRADEHPKVDNNMRFLPIPDTGPLYGHADPLIDIWNSIQGHQKTQRNIDGHINLQ